MLFLNDNKVQLMKEKFIIDEAISRDDFAIEQLQQPFGKIHLLIILISGISFCAEIYFSAFTNVWIDLILWSGLVIICVALTYFFKFRRILILSKINYSN